MHIFVLFYYYKINFHSLDSSIPHPPSALSTANSLNTIIGTAHPQTLKIYSGFTVANIQYLAYWHCNISVYSGFTVANIQYLACWHCNISVYSGFNVSVLDGITCNVFLSIDKSRAFHGLKLDSYYFVLSCSNLHGHVWCIFNTRVRRINIFSWVACFCIVMHFFAMCHVS